jgi:hypothetical protein
MSSITVNNETLGSVALPTNTRGHSGAMSVKTTKQHLLRHLVYLTLLATLATAHTVWAQATAARPISGVIGKLQSFDGKSLDVATSSGVVHVSVKQPLTTYKQIPSDLSHVASAPYIGVASAEQDGKQVAKQIFIFPAELRGAAEGSVLTDPPGATTHSRMTNGTVSRPAVSHSRMTNGTLWFAIRTAPKRSPYRLMSQSQRSHLKRSLLARAMSSTRRLRSSRTEHL